MMVREYIFLAASCISVGVVITFVVLALCQNFGVDINRNLWVLAVPTVLSLFLNISLIEIYRRYKKRQ